MQVLLPALMAVAVAVPAWAVPPAEAPASGVSRAADIPQAVEDSAVVLEGSLGRQVEEELYIFEDASGETIVEIDDDLVRDRPLAPGSKVRVRGVVEKDGRAPYVEAESVESLE